MKKVNVSKDQEMAQSVGNCHSKNQGETKLNSQSGTNTVRTFRNSSEQLWSLSYTELTKSMKTYITCNCHKISRTTTQVPH